MTRDTKDDNKNYHTIYNTIYNDIHNNIHNNIHNIIHSEYNTKHNNKHKYDVTETASTAKSPDITVGIIDYGAGNLGSVTKAFRFLDIPCRIISSPDQLKSSPATGLVLPGVGAFGPAMNRLRQSGFLPVLRDYLSEDRPFLGICLGMQLLMQCSEEAPGVPGLGVVEGSCKRFTRGKVPQIGWNRINSLKFCPLLNNIPDNTFFYFVHSYYVYEPTSRWTTAVTDYYAPFPSILQEGSRFAVQFHPEKSGPAGLTLLQNWVHTFRSKITNYGD